MPVAGLGAATQQVGVARDIGPRNETTRTQSRDSTLENATACTIVDLAFERSPRLGQVVRVRAGEGTEALRAALERYAFKFEVQD